MAVLFPLLRPKFRPPSLGCRRDLRSGRCAHLAPLPFRSGSCGRSGSTTDDPAQFPFKAFDPFPDCNGLFELLERYVCKKVGLHGNPVRESSERSQGLILWTPHGESTATAWNRSCQSRAERTPRRPTVFWGAFPASSRPTAVVGRDQKPS